MSDDPRRHHYVAKMYLAGFTDTGTKLGKLWVADSKRGYHKKCPPDGIAHSRDFYRVDVPDIDPFIIERQLGNIEGDVATVLKDVVQNKRLPGGEDLSLLLNFVALQMTKTPAMREMLAKPMVAVLERVMDLMLQNPDRFYSSVEGARKAGRDIDDNVSYEEMKRIFDQDGFIVSTSQNWDVKTALEMADEVLPFLHHRNWSLIVAENEEDLFICSDHPVVVHWIDEKMIKHPPALGSRRTAVFMPLCSKMALRGSFEDVSPLIVADSKQVASYNSLTLMNRYAQVYSRKEAFKAINPVGDIVQLSIAELAADPHVYLTKKLTTQTSIV